MISLNSEDLKTDFSAKNLTFIFGPPHNFRYTIYVREIKKMDLLPGTKSELTLYNCQSTFVVFHQVITPDINVKGYPESKFCFYRLPLQRYNCEAAKLVKLVDQLTRH